MILAFCIISKNIITAFLWMLSGVAFAFARNILFILLLVLVVWLALVVSLSVLTDLVFAFECVYGPWKKSKRVANDVCVCLDTISSAVDWTLLPCGHCLHSGCCRNWRRHNRRDDLVCPYCRQPPGYFIHMSGAGTGFTVEWDFEREHPGDLIVFSDSAYCQRTWESIFRATDQFDRFASSHLKQYF